MELKIRDRKGQVHTVKVRKPEYEELGLEFDTYLMDKEKSCRNQCIFCFIDQLPKGMRESLYFKDDDSRLSFLFGNYVTLTNLTEHEISRIIKMHISPINVSVHTTNPELRVKMMNNRFAGDALKILKRLSEHNIAINTQIVCCPGWNDGEELKRSLRDLYDLNVNLIGVVPVGITKYREGLAKLTPFTVEKARETVDILEEFGEMCLKTRGKRIAYAADELYIKAGYEMLSDTLNDILGKRMDRDFLAEIRKTICEDENVNGAFDLILHSYGPDRLIGSVHVEVPGDMTAPQIDQLERSIASRVYEKHKVVLTGIGIYAADLDDQASSIRADISRMLMKKEGVLQLHGFYIDTQKKILTFDVILDLELPDREETYKEIVREVQEAYPDYTLNVTMDLDF